MSTSRSGSNVSISIRRKGALLRFSTKPKRMEETEKDASGKTYAERKNEELASLKNRVGNF